MAVEYQANTYFFRNATQQMNRSMADRFRAGQIPMIFLPNFVHDLESVLWQYLWFLHNRIPCVAAKQVESSVLLSALSDISTSAYRLFSHGINGNPARERFLTLPEELSSRFSLATTFSRIIDQNLLEPFAVIEELRVEYMRIEGCDPETRDDGRQWFPTSTFTKDKVYGTFKSQFERILNWMGSGQNFPVEDSNTLLEGLQPDQRSMPAPPDPPRAKGSRRSEHAPSPTPAGTSRGSSRKRSHADAQAGDEEVEQTLQPEKSTLR